MKKTIRTKSTFKKQIDDFKAAIDGYVAQLNRHMKKNDYIAAQASVASMQVLFDVIDLLGELDAPEAISAAAETNTPKKRGRKPKPKTEGEVKVPKKRGRKPKAKVAAEAAVPKKRGRPKKTETSAAPKKKGKKRGRRKGARGRRAAVGTYLTQKDYYQPIMEVIRDHGGSMPSKECMTKVRDKLAHVLRDGDFEAVGSTKVERWAYLVPWARIKLVKAGLMKQDSPRKMWELSDAGKDWLAGNSSLTVDDIDKVK